MGFFSKIKESLKKTKDAVGKKLFAVFVIVAGLHDLFAKKKKPDPDRE